jgi:hypothetical protein
MLRQAQLICLFVLLTVIVVLLVTDYASVASFFPAEFGVPKLGRGKLWLAGSILSLISVIASYSVHVILVFSFYLNHQ